MYIKVKINIEKYDKIICFIEGVILIFGVKMQNDFKIYECRNLNVSKYEYVNMKDVQIVFLFV